MQRTCGSCGAANRIPEARVVDTAKCGRCKASLPPVSVPITINDEKSFDALIAASPVPVLVDFWAEWCGPCRMVAPEVANVANTLVGKVVVAKVNTEKVPALAQRYRVNGIPNFGVFERGRLVKQQAGAMRAPELVAFATTPARAT